MKTIITFLLFTFLLFTNISFGQDLILNFKDGSEIVYSINTIHTLTYESGNLKVNLNSETAELYDLETIQKIIFAKSESSVSEFGENIKVDIFPNPFNNILKVRFKEVQSKNYIIDLINSNGERIMSKEVNPQTTNEESLKVANLPAGIYYLRISDLKNQLITKIIKS